MKKKIVINWSKFDLLGKTERTSLSTSSRLIGLNYFCAKRKEARSAECSRMGRGSLSQLPNNIFDFHNLFELVHVEAIIS